MFEVNPSRPILATIHVAALRRNLLRVKAATASAGDAKVWAVVKANAYGHGVRHVFAGLQSADGFACLDVTEAEALRSMGWRGPILLLEGAFNPRDLELCSRLNLWHVIHCEAQIDWLAAHKTHQPQRIFLKLNSGMNRLGFKPTQYRAAYARLAMLSQVAEVSHLTHYSAADSHAAQGTAAVARQWEVFQKATQDLAGECSLGNSASALRTAQLSGDWVRAGVALYGAAPDYPAKTSADWGLQPAMTLSSRIISVQEVAVGDSVGYGVGNDVGNGVSCGSAFVAERPMRIGTVACGYADGYPRSAGRALAGAPVLVDGQRTQTLGRISMDLLAVDLTQLPSSGFDSRVTLWGVGLPIDEVAAAAGTISYELMCAVAPRVPFVVVE